MSTLKRIGVFGGTFDPIHNAHIEIARAAMAFASLDVVLFVVASSPPHKQEGVGASPEQRFVMVEAALSSEDQMEPCDIEMHRDGPSYMAVTLSELAGRYSSSELFLIVGLDSLVDIPNWYEPGEIYRLAHILVVSRPDESRSIAPELEGQYDLVPFEESSVSSTSVRKSIRSGEALEGIVPSAIIPILSEGRYYE